MKINPTQVHEQMSHPVLPVFRENSLELEKFSKRSIFKLSFINRGRIFISSGCASAPRWRWGREKGARPAEKDPLRDGHT